MKKYLFFLVLASTLSLAAPACDVCGGGGGSYNPFLFPHLSRSYVGMNYLYRHYHTHAPDGTTSTAFSTIMLTGQYKVAERLQLAAFVPYQLGSLQSPTRNKTQNGLSDISLLASYRLWDREGKQLRQSLIAGAGVKLATGTYTPVSSDAALNRNFQLGSGSTDFLVNGIYRLGWKAWSLAAVGAYKYNTANRLGYRYGNQLTLGGTLAWRKDLRHFSVSPYLQLVNEKQYADADNHVPQADTESSNLYTGGGVDLSTKRFTLGAAYQFVAGGIASGEFNSAPRLTLRFSVNL